MYQEIARAEKTGKCEVWPNCMTHNTPGVYAIMPKPVSSGWGRDFTSAMEKYDHMSGVWICDEDLAVAENRITLHPTEKDQYGLAKPVVTKSDHNNELVMRNPIARNPCSRRLRVADVIRRSQYKQLVPARK